MPFNEIRVELVNFTIISLSTGILIVTTEILLCRFYSIVSVSKRKGMAVYLNFMATGTRYGIVKLKSSLYFYWINTRHGYGA